MAASTDSSPRAPKALVLVGGYGTRLRPLTLTVPKPIIDFGNKPMICHQIEALKEAGCDEVVLAINYRPQVMMDFLKEWEEKLGIKITCSQEPEPMGTAGPLALARHILEDGHGTPFFVLNSDVICEYPLKEMLEVHRASGAEATILVTKVEDPSKYGVVVTTPDGRVDRFVEKPRVFVGDRINAGIYCLNPSVLDRIQPRPTSIEKEVFPAIAADGRLHTMNLEGYWMDVGQPKDYLTGLGLHLACVRNRRPQELAAGEGVRGDVIIDDTAVIGQNCLIGPNVSIGKLCVIGDGVRLSNCVLLHRVTVKNYARVSDSIVGWGSSVGSWARVDNKAVIGEDVVIRDEIYMNGAIVLPHKEIKESVLDPGTIIM
ncbi:GMP1 [Auxenochlorella protothecoides x Auxenochlorella symbiontica]|uniref:mannose-1-phosphate guanylyltransferase n=2 Tax=Auxenochlorella protothecoides TaxID=3075 RepID=A0A087SLR1_AUXPR|nr:Mannose-1-phosphate guanyltransferase [Auxenochlorella protothecoides]KFM26665.1 Mannose-1-phosphate guanyltransferase [Auxenochlorella protothecoides]